MVEEEELLDGGFGCSFEVVLREDLIKVERFGVDLLEQVLISVLIGEIGVIAFEK